MSSGQLRSYLASRVVASMDTARIKREAWCNEGDFVLMADQIAELPLQDRQTIERIATRAYGVKLIRGFK